jgi:hypothetical protein
VETDFCSPTRFLRLPDVLFLEVAILAEVGGAGVNCLASFVITRLVKVGGRGCKKMLDISLTCFG